MCRVMLHNALLPPEGQPVIGEMCGATPQGSIGDASRPGLERWAGEARNMRADTVGCGPGPGVSRQAWRQGRRRGARRPAARSRGWPVS